MSLDLDERQRAMLGEMGIRVFDAPRGPQPPAAPPAPVLRSPPAAVAPARPIAPSASDETVAHLDWDALAQSALAIGASRGARVVFGSGDLQPEWLIVGDAPVEAEEREGQPFVGEAGTLLDNMLRAVGLGRRNKVYLTSLVKVRPAGNGLPSPDDLAQWEPVLRRQVELLRPRVIVAMGRFTVPALLNTNEPIGKLRGQRHEYAGVPVVVTYHPAYLLRNLAEKGKAWADLCLALEIARSQPG
jgi:DNA polymerase